MLKIELDNYSESRCNYSLIEETRLKVLNSDTKFFESGKYSHKNFYFNVNVKDISYINNKAIAETHPYRPIREVIPISFFEISPNFNKNNGEEEYFYIKSIDQIKKDYKKSILSYYDIFPEKFFGYKGNLEKHIDLWISQINTPCEADKKFISFLKEELLNDKVLSYEEIDCERIIGPAYILLTELYNETYESLKDLYGIKYYESLKGSIKGFKN